MEHGFEQGIAVRTILEQLGYAQVSTSQDYAGLDRVTMGCWLEIISNDVHGNETHSPYCNCVKRFTVCRSLYHGDGKLINDT